MEDNFKEIVSLSLYADKFKSRGLGSTATSVLESSFACSLALLAKVSVRGSTLDVISLGAGVFTSLKLSSGS